jgi:hypothetical protein
MHLAARRANDKTDSLKHHRVPLRTELILSILLSLLLGFNAIFATGQQGPAQTVGNLYYASWGAFLLCVRICLGCLEEVSRGENEILKWRSCRHGPVRHSFFCFLQYHDINDEEEDAIAHNVDSSYAAAPDQTNDKMTDSPVDALEKNRVKRLRSYFFLFIFSLVCAFSALDAALNQRKVSSIQGYMILAPSIVSALSAVMFAFCLSKRCYTIVSHFLVGGVLSIFCFGVWLGDLLLTMHSEDSWAVNSIGEIKSANRT